MIVREPPWSSSAGGPVWEPANRDETYAGGLTKFEPREMELLIVPGPAMLDAGAVQ